ncbi:MAG TPA: MerR family transcriptional regulator [Acidobacteriaceae bacterium]|nr:MerR family transcriptional regulator [Acidobacteriaceae bacterium]
MLAPASQSLSNKSPEAFRTISEVAVELDVPQHVLRFWEGRFAQIKPVKRAGGRRYYRPEDVDLLRGVRALLYSEGFTIKGVQKVLRDRGIRYVAELGRGEARYAISERMAAAKAEIAQLPHLVERSNVIALERAAPVADAVSEPTKPLAESERVKLELLLAELLQLKARLPSRATP